MTLPATRQLPLGNLIRIRRATVAFVVCVLCLVVSIWVTLFHYAIPTLLLTVVVLVEAVLTWLARVVYGWLDTTPARVEVVKVVRWGPIFVGLGGISAAWTMMNMGVQVDFMWMMLVMLMVLISDAAGAIAGSVR